jgi:hypothetical protein
VRCAARVSQWVDIEQSVRRRAMLIVDQRQEPLAAQCDSENDEVVLRLTKSRAKSH